jgi:hypothetical protein
MMIELLGSVADFIPTGLLRNELMEAVPHLGIVIQAISSDGEAVSFRQNLTQGCAAHPAE